MFIRKDGSTFPVAYSAIPLRVESVNEGMAIVFRDVSEPGTSPTLIRVVIADSDSATSDAFEAVLNRHEGVDVVAAETTAAAAIAAVQSVCSPMSCSSTTRFPTVTAWPRRWPSRPRAPMPTSSS